MRLGACAFVRTRKGRQRARRLRCRLRGTIAQHSGRPRDIVPRGRRKAPTGSEERRVTKPGHGEAFVGSTGEFITWFQAERVTQL
jgi:hypothetical protein